MNLVSTCLIVTQLFAATTCQLSGTFTYLTPDFKLAYVVGHYGDVRLTVEDTNGRRSRGISYPLKMKGPSQSTLEGFFTTNYTVDFGVRRKGRIYFFRRRRFLLPVLRLLPGVNLVRGDLGDITFTDRTRIMSRFEGQERWFAWETINLSPGVFKFRETTGDLNEVTIHIVSDRSASINVSCRGLQGVSATFDLARSVSRRTVAYDMRPTSSLNTFRKQVTDLCGNGRFRFLFSGVLAADENRIYTPYLIPGRNSLLLPLDRITH